MSMCDRNETGIGSVRVVLRSWTLCHPHGIEQQEDLTPAENSPISIGLNSNGLGSLMVYGRQELNWTWQISLCVENLNPASIICMWLNSICSTSAGSSCKAVWWVGSMARGSVKINGLRPTRVKLELTEFVLRIWIMFLSSSRNQTAWVFSLSWKQLQSCAMSIEFDGKGLSGDRWSSCDKSETGIGRVCIESPNHTLIIHTGSNDVRIRPWLKAVIRQVWSGWKLVNR